MTLAPAVQQLVDESVLCWLATSSAAGQPSVSPKEIFTTFNDDSIIIANIASPNSARNIRENGRACVSFVNIFTQKGFQVRGEAAYLDRTHDTYEAIARILNGMTAGAFPFKSAFRIMADEVSEILAPRYRLYPETTEADQINSAMARYGVRPRDENPSTKH